MTGQHAIHEVFNQSPPFKEVDLFALDRPLAATRLAENHASMYGAVDLASDDIGGLLDRALPV
jgi:hypothetical protein